MPYYKLWGSFLLNVEAEDEHQAEQKVGESLSELLKVSDENYARAEIDGVTLEHTE